MKVTTSGSVTLEEAFVFVLPDAALLLSLGGVTLLLIAGRHTHGH